MSKDQQLANIHAQAKCDFENTQCAVRAERQQCLEDRRFYSIAGAQWEGALSQQFANKPKFEVNKVHLAVIKIINEYRNNRISVEFISKDGANNDDLADTCNGLYRADEQDSCAEEAYDNAFEEAIGGGFGAWRLRACNEDEEDDENDYQRIRIEPIYDADSCVFFDLNAKRQDKSDAKYCFILTAMTVQAYMDEWGDDPTTWDKSISSAEFDWASPDVVYVAEYYKIEKVKDNIHVFELITGEEERYTDKQLEDDPELLVKLNATGAKEVRVKKVTRNKVHKYIMSGGKILEDCGIIAGKFIPIVPVYGKRWYVDGIERCMGHVRLCKDPQRLKNMQLSKLGELSAASSIEKPIVTPEQILGHELLWAEDNINNNPYLLINPMKDMNDQIIASAPTAYTKPPIVPPAMAALLQLSEQDLKDILGNQEAGDELQANLSGVAVGLIQGRLDMQSYIYISNFAKAVKRSGEIWLSMASEIYVENGRTMKTVGNQSEIDSVELFKPKVNKDGLIENQNDLSKARFDVAVDVGPTSSSRRSATVRALTEMLPVVGDQDTQQVLTSMIMMNMEGEGITEVRDYFRQKLVRMNVVEPTEEEAQQLAAEAQNQQPDPQALYLQAAAQEAQAKAAKAEADTVLVVTKAEETRAKTAETLSKMSRGEQQAVLDLVQQLNQQTATAQPMSEGESYV